jgi:hypothetical protein
MQYDAICGACPAANEQFGKLSGAVGRAAGVAGAADGSTGGAPMGGDGAGRIAGAAGEQAWSKPSHRAIAMIDREWRRTVISS